MLPQHLEEFPPTAPDIENVRGFLEQRHILGDAFANVFGTASELILEAHVLVAVECNAVPGAERWNAWRIAKRPLV